MGQLGKKKLPLLPNSMGAVAQFLEVLWHQGEVCVESCGLLQPDDTVLESGFKGTLDLCVPERG